MSLDYDDKRRKPPASKNKKAAGTGKTQHKGVKNSEKRQGKKRSDPRRSGKNKKTGAVSKIILAASVCVLVFSLCRLVMMLVPYYSGSKEYDDVKENAITVEQQEEGAEDLFKVDFDTLLAMNPDTVAWLRFEEPAVISYPVVKSADNIEYLTKTFSANDNKLGAIFLDMRSNRSFADRNSIIYGHNLQIGGEMFSQLPEYASEEFCRQHPYFYIYTPDGMARTYQVFSAAVVKATADNYDIVYATEDEFVDYLQMCKATSNYQADVTLDAASKIVSLSTCTNVNDDERFLVQGVLINEERNWE